MGLRVTSNIHNQGHSFQGPSVQRSAIEYSSLVWTLIGEVISETRASRLGIRVTLRAAALCHVSQER